MAYNGDVGLINTGAPAVHATFQGITGLSVAAGQRALILLAGWSSDNTAGARISGITDNQGNVWTEVAFERKTNGFSLAHGVSVWTVASTIGGSAITATLTPVDGSAVSIWDGVIFTYGGTGALEQAAVANDQAPTQTSIITGSISPASSVVLFAIGMSIADSFGTITADTPTYTSLGSSTTAEGFGSVFREVPAGTYSHTWALGYTSQYGPISLIVPFELVGGGGGTYLGLPELAGGLTPLTGGMQL